MPASDELARRFGALYTAALTDVLDAIGLPCRTLPPSIGPLAPWMRVAGPAFAVEGFPRPDAPYEPSIRRILAMLGDVPSGNVAVYSTHDDLSAQFGELSAVALDARGCAGVVLDGGCRDTDFIREEGFPVFARYCTPQDSVPRWQAQEWGHTVEIGGVEVVTGDYVVGDADGVVVIPGARVGEVLERAEGVAQTENEVREAVRQGTAPLEAFERFGKF